MGRSLGSTPIWLGHHQAPRSPPPLSKEMSPPMGSSIRAISLSPTAVYQGAALFPDFAFTGHYYHARSGLYLAPYRAYNPSIGRWLSRDPLGEKGGLNLYAYVGNDPVNRVDPFGLFPRGPWNRGRCCNTSRGVEWASVVGRGWIMLQSGDCVGLFDGKDCEGMTCGGGFYYVHGLAVGTCATPRCDSKPYTNRRWTPDPTTRDPGGLSPTERGMGGYGDTPPNYIYGPRSPK